ncbi:unnamed protein product, partial [Didymodactylos carnosus]
MVISRYCIKRIVIAFVRVKLMALERGVVLSNFRNCCASIVVNPTTLAVLVERGNHAHEEVKVEHPLVRNLKRKVGHDISPVPHQYEGVIHEM